MPGLSSDSPISATEVLRRDHDEVERLFDQFDDARDESNAELKAQIVAVLCRELTLHAQIEEEIFYPAVRRSDEADELVDEAAVEHRTLANLVAELGSAAPDDELYDARVKVLGEYVKHHVELEEGEMFPAARRAGLDLEALGLELLARKETLVAEAQGTPVVAPRTPRKPPARTRSATKPAARKSAPHGGRH